MWSVQLQLVSGESIIRKYYKMYKVYKMLQEQLSWKENGSEKLLQKNVCMSLEEYLLVNQVLLPLE